jgi:phenylacetate-CoA ligase
MRDLIRAHAARVPEIAARLARAGIELDAPFDDTAFARIPLLRKSALRALQAAAPPWGGMLAEGFQPSAAFLSPGHVAEPLVPRMVERLAGMLREAGFGSGHTVLNGFGYHVTPAGMLFHEALVQAGCRLLPAGPQNTATLVEYARALGANAFVGIASHLKILFEAEPARQIRLAMAGAEPNAERIRATLRALHGVRCVDMYGFAEGGIVAASCAVADALHLHADATAEVLDPASGAAVEPGEAGELVISLDNPGFPLLRFANGDWVRIAPGACACGRIGILQVLGRADQSVRVKGMLLHPSQLQAFMAAAGADACRVAVTRRDDRDRIAVAWRPGAGTQAAGASTIDTHFRDACRVRPDSIEIDAALAAGSCVLEDRRKI